jgi:hypothetical protein
MFYDINHNLILARLPKNLIKQDGTVFINFNESDAQTLVNYGYYIIRNDTPRPPNSIEDLAKRNIIIDNEYVDIERTWICNKSLEISVTPEIIEENNVL